MASNFGLIYYELLRSDHSACVVLVENLRKFDIRLGEVAPVCPSLVLDLPERLSHAGLFLVEAFVLFHHQSNFVLFAKLLKRFLLARQQKYFLLLDLSLTCLKNPC